MNPLPCPFCNHKLTVMMEIDDGSFCVVCAECSAVGPFTLDQMQPRDEAIRRWNERRHTPEGRLECCH